MYPNVLPDQWHSFYDPPLTYYENHTDTDYRRVIFAKGKTHGIQPPLRRALGNSKLSLTKRNSNPNPGQLVVSKYEGHSAKELCGSEQSFRPDFVSISEGIFCDMSTKEAWPVCGQSIANGCFDLDKEEMISNGPQRRDEHTGRTVPKKSYYNTSHWGKGER